MRMLDNAIDVNFSPPAKSETPTCATVAWPFWDCLYALKLPYASPEALDFSGNSMEAVCYFAYLASNKLGVEHGAYSSFQSSLLSKRNLLRDDSLHCNFGIDLIDTIKLEYRYAEIPCHAPCWARMPPCSKPICVLWATAGACKSAWMRFIRAQASLLPG